jgi:hypothetical protein
MSIRRTVAVAGALAAVSCWVAAPAANAAPMPGDPCSAPVVSAGNAMWCDMQAGLWISRGSATPGQPCDTLGDVRLARGEDLAHCAQTGSGRVWVMGAR